MEGTLQRPRRADARRNIEAILDAAAVTLADNPRASMQEVAAAAGVHRATVHRHFPARDDLLAALTERSIAGTLALLNDEDLTGGEAGPALRRLTRAVLEIGDRDRMWRISPAFAGSVGGPHGHQVQQLGAPLIRLLSRGQGEGSVRRDVDALVLASVWGGLLLSSLNLLAMGVLDLDRATEVVCLMVTTA